MYGVAGPPLTFSTALRILGKHESRLLERLDQALGATILAAGVGLATVPATAPPLVMFALVWGWVDQKNQAVALLRDLVSGLSRRLGRTRGRERRDLIEAAHSVIVVAAFLEVLAETIGRKARAAVEKRREQLLLSSETTFRQLYRSEIPAPDVRRGFRENLQPIEEWVEHALDMFTMFAGLDTTPEDPPFAKRVLDRYQTHYLVLAREVPEFLIWSLLGEHATTRAAITDIAAELRDRLDSQGGALDRLERLLAVPDLDDTTGSLAALQRANRALLTRPVVPADPEHYGAGIVFPTVDRAFIRPRYRTALWSRDFRPADEDWWRDHPVRDDLDLMLVGHITMPEAARTPLLILGHPGAGKSLLTKVIAARLPTESYTVVRVPLRVVAADAPIATQIQQALLHATNSDIPWARLAEDSADTIRVVLLDGLDELLQASGHDRVDYLHEIERFQRVEHEQERPVVVIVTSRTLLADRVAIPVRSVVVKLEDFDQAQIAAWLARWAEANRASIAAGRVRGLTENEAVVHHDLARLPLLLLMLALHAADPGTPPLGAELSKSALYEQVLDNFTRREVHKGRIPPGRTVASEVAAQLARLAVAALAMVNRGTQYIHEDAVRDDLDVLVGEPVDPGKRVLGRFFFVHTAEALVGTTRRAYEFLHTTFGDYLAARYVLDVLRVMSADDDERLHALLSHQVWATRQPVVDFAGEYFEQLPEDERTLTRLTLVELIRTYRTRVRTPGRYRPTKPDFVRATAVYSVNLMTLLVAFSDTLTLTEVFGGTPTAALRTWRSTLSLWESLEEGSWRTVLGQFTVTEDLAVRGLFGARWQMTEGYADLSLANVGLRRERARLLGLGLAVTGQVVDDQQHWVDSALAWIAGLRAGLHSGTSGLPMPPPTASPEDADRVARAIEDLPDAIYERLSPPAPDDEPGHCR